MKSKLTQNTKRKEEEKEDTGREDLGLALEKEVTTTTTNHIRGLEKEGKSDTEVREITEKGITELKGNIAMNGNIAHPEGLQGTKEMIENEKDHMKETKEGGSCRTIETEEKNVHTKEMTGEEKDLTIGTSAEVVDLAETGNEYLKLGRQDPLPQSESLLLRLL